MLLLKLTLKRTRRPSSAGASLPTMLLIGAYCANAQQPIDLMSMMRRFWKGCLPRLSCPPVSGEK